ncbi:unnamed protein product [Rhizophagus irregularis]|nr:unnamed protein product [Rhizophagus irregularis]
MMELHMFFMLKTRLIKKQYLVIFSIVLKNLVLCNIAASDLTINTTHTIVDPDVDLLSRNPSFFTLYSLHQIRLNTQE